MSALFDELDTVDAGHSCRMTLRVHTDVHGQFSTYACNFCVDAKWEIARERFPAPAVVLVSPLGRSA